jgi:hypothetical protein
MSRAVLQQVLDALVIAEAGLADIGDADREPGDDLAWCEARAAEAFAQPRAAIAALQKELAKPEQDAIDAYRKIIKVLAELVTMPQTDKQYKSDVLSRPDVMEKVTSIRYYACDLFHSAHTVITEARK